MIRQFLQAESATYDTDRFIQSFKFKPFDFSFCQKAVEQQKSFYNKYLQDQIFPKLKFKQSKQNFLRNTSIQTIPQRSWDGIEVKKQFKKITTSIQKGFKNHLEWSGENNLVLAKKTTFFIWNKYNGNSKQISLDKGMHRISSFKINVNNVGAVGYHFGKILLFNIQKAKTLNTNVKHLGHVNALDWNKNILISGGGDGSVYGWDFRIKRNKEIFLYRTHNQGITAVKSNQIGNNIAVGGQDSNIIILDLRSSQKILTNFQLKQNKIRSLDWCPSNPQILTTIGGPFRNSIYFLNLATEELSYYIKTESQIFNLLYSKQTDRLITCHGKPFSQIKVWQTNNKWKNIQSIKNSCKMFGHQNIVTGLAINRAGDTIATGSPDQTLRLWHPFDNLLQDSQLNNAVLR